MNQDRDRREQLDRFAVLAFRASSAFETHDSEVSAAYATVADEAVRLVRDGYKRSEVLAVVSARPPLPVWMNPTEAAFDALRQDWQEEAASVLEELDAAALDLRSIGQFD